MCNLIAEKEACLMSLLVIVKEVWPAYMLQCRRCGLRACYSERGVACVHVTE